MSIESSGEIPHLGDPASMSVHDVVDALQTDPLKGLRPRQARLRLVLHGPNTVHVKPSTPLWTLVARLLRLPGVLLGIGLLTALAAHEAGLVDRRPRAAWALAAMVVLWTIVGVVEDRRRRRNSDSAERGAVVSTWVVRSGERFKLDVVDLVPGDLVWLSRGNLVPADARLVAVNGLEVMETALNGSDRPSPKTTEPLEPDAGRGERPQMVFAGTVVVGGDGLGVVTSTGDETELGRIAALIGEDDEPSAVFRRRFERLDRGLAAVVAVPVVIVLTRAILRLFSQSGGAVEWMDTVLSVLAAASLYLPLRVGSVPTWVAHGVMRQLRGAGVTIRRAGVLHRLAAVSTAGIDAGSFLTPGRGPLEMMVLPSGDVYLADVGDDGEAIELVDHEGHLIGGPTMVDEVQWLTLGAALSVAADDEVETGPGRDEGWLIDAMYAAGLDIEVVDARFHRVVELAYTPDRKMISAVHSDEVDDDALRLTSYGAAEVVLAHCWAERCATKVVAMDDDRRSWWTQRIEEVAQVGLRPMAVTWRPVESDEIEGPDVLELSGRLERDPVLLGIMGFQDPVADLDVALEQLRIAGITPVVFGEDHPTTTAVLVDKAGLTPGGDRFRSSIKLVSGDTTETMSDIEIADIDVFARMSPADKRRPVEALQGVSGPVAMSGQHAQDVTALVRSDVLYSSTQQADQAMIDAADVVLWRGNLTLLARAATAARTVAPRSMARAHHTLSSVLAVSAFLTLVPMLGLVGVEMGSLPALAAAHIILLALMISLGSGLVAAAHGGVGTALSHRTPTSATESVRATVIPGAVAAGLLVAGSAVFAYYRTVSVAQDPTVASSVALSVLLFAQLFGAIFFSAERLSLSGRMSRNLRLARVGWLWAGAAFVCVPYVVIVQVGQINEVFNLGPLGAGEWLLAVMLAAVAPMAGSGVGALIDRRAVAAQMASAEATAAKATFVERNTPS